MHIVVLNLSKLRDQIKSIRENIMFDVDIIIRDIFKEAKYLTILAKI